MSDDCRTPPATVTISAVPDGEPCPACEDLPAQLVEVSIVRMLVERAYHGAALARQRGEAGTGQAAWRQPMSESNCRLAELLRALADKLERSEAVYEFEWNAHVGIMENPFIESGCRSFSAEPPYSVHVKYWPKVPAAVAP